MSMEKYEYFYTSSLISLNKLDSLHPEMKQKWLRHPRTDWVWRPHDLSLYCDVQYAFVPVPQEETPMEGESASLMVKFKIKINLNINS